MTMLIVSHEMTFIRDVATHLVMMAEGRVVEEGEAERLTAAPAEAYTRALMAAAFDLRATEGAQKA